MSWIGRERNVMTHVAGVPWKSIQSDGTGSPVLDGQHEAHVVLRCRCVFRKGGLERSHLERLEREERRHHSHGIPVHGGRQQGSPALRVPSPSSGGQRQHRLEHAVRSVLRRHPLPHPPPRAALLHRRGITAYYFLSSLPKHTRSPEWATSSA